MRQVNAWLQKLRAADGWLKAAAQPGGRDPEPAGEAQRLQVRDTLQASLLADARRQPADPLSNWMLGICDAAHAPIARGDPPLTRHVAEAYAEVEYFLLSVVATGEGRRIDQDFGPLGRQAWVDAIAADYASYPPDQQRQLTKVPLFRAAIGEAWPILSARSDAGCGISAGRWSRHSWTERAARPSTP